MTLTATRDSALELVGLKAKAKSPDALVEEALAGFTALETKLTTAVAEVENQESNLVQERLALDEKISKAQTARTHLKRIQTRLQEFIS